MKKGDILKANSLKGYSVIIFMAITNIFYCDFVGFNYLIDNYKQNAWIMILFLFIINIIICLPFKGFKKSFSPLKEIKNNVFVKTIVILYIVLSAVMLTLFSSFIIKNYFYYETPIQVFIVLTTIVSIIISFQSFNSIISSAILFFFFFGFFYIFPLFFLKEHDFSLLLPIDIDIKNFYKVFLMALYLLDNFLLVFYSPNIDNGFKRKHIFIGNTILIIYFLYITIDSTTLLGANYYLNTKMAGFLRWQLFKGDSLLENYDVFLLVMITVTTIYKLSMHFNILRLITGLKKNNKYLFIFIAVFLSLSLVANCFILQLENNFVFLSTIAFLLIFILYLYFTKKSMEDYRESNTDAQ